MPYNKEYRDKWRASASRPKSLCHPNKVARARGMCDACYDRWLYANSDKNRATKLRNAAKWKAANPEKIKAGQRANRLKKRYGITEADYQSMLVIQRGVCALCCEPAKLHIDHCHVTGVVRGLLCLRCNGSLAWVEELLKRNQTTWFTSAMEYLTNAEKNSKTKS